METKTKRSEKQKTGTPPKNAVAKIKGQKIDNRPRGEAAPKKNQDGKRGVKKGVKKTTEEEFERRVDFVEALISKGYNKRDLKNALAKYCDLSARQAETYISRARKNLLLRVNEGLDVHRSEAYAFYAAIKKSKEATLVEKLRAQKEIDELLGLRAAKKFQIEEEISMTASVQTEDVGEDRDDIDVPSLLKNMTTEELRKFRDARQMLREVLRNAQGNVVEAISVS